MSTSITKQGILLADGVEIGENLITESYSITKYNISNFTKETGVKVSEWGCYDAIRIYGNGGTSKIVCTVGSGVKSISGQAYVYSLFIKNNHATNSIYYSTNIGQSSRLITPGESGVIITNATGNGTSYIQFNLNTHTAGDEFDITFWHPKIEIGSIATPWTPAPTDDIYVGDHGFFEGSDKGSIGKGYMEGNEFYEI